MARAKTRETLASSAEKLDLLLSSGLAPDIELLSVAMDLLSITQGREGLCPKFLTSRDSVEVVVVGVAIEL